MELDKAAIRIRERSTMELLDLALCVLRRHGLVLLPAFLLLAIPCAVLNDFIVDYMCFSGYVPQPEAPPEDGGRIIGFFFLQSVLASLEFPLISAWVTIYLGRVTFRQPADLNLTTREWFGRLGRILWRAVVPRALTLVFLQAMTRPFLVEILVLERPGRRDFSQRARYFHENMGGLLLPQYLGETALTTILVGVFWIGFRSLHGLLRDVPALEDWVVAGGFRVEFPLALWLVLAWCAVVRYLRYLDLRIRREGWEVELLMRAEAEKLHKRLEVAE